jgi:hypothetical protein
VAVLAAVCASTAGCADDGPYVPPDTTMRLPAIPALPGVVTADGVADVAVDVGAARPISVTLANVAVADCGPDSPAALTGALARLLPVGTPVVLIRSAVPTTAADALTAYVFVRHGHDVDATSPTGPSVNELVLASGSGRFDPPIDRAATAPAPDRQVAADVARMPTPDRTYLPALAGAETTAWQARLGALAACVDRQRDLDLAVAPPRPSAAPAPPTVVVAVNTNRPGVRIEQRLRHTVCRLLARC